MTDKAQRVTRSMTGEERTKIKRALLDLLGIVEFEYHHDPEAAGLPSWKAAIEAGNKALDILAGLTRIVKQMGEKDRKGDDETEWGPDESHAPDCAYRNKGECTCPKSEPKTKRFAVYVVDKRSIKYVVDANSEEEAQRMVEASEDADAEFGGRTLDGSEWYVDWVEEL